MRNKMVMEESEGDLGAVYGICCSWALGYLEAFRNVNGKN